MEEELIKEIEEEWSNKECCLTCNHFTRKCITSGECMVSGFNMGIDGLCGRYSDRREKLFVYAQPNTMEGHNFSDDVAICYANNKEEAVEIFKRGYSYPNLEEYVREPYFNSDKFAVLTDY